MDYQFEEFTSMGSKLSNYSISVNRASYSLGFNSGFYTKENINNYKKVTLLYDNKNKAIAFKFINENKKGAFTVIHGKNGHSGSVTAKSFFVNKEIDKEEYFGQKNVNKIQDDNFGKIFVINLLDNKKQME